MRNLDYRDYIRIRLPKPLPHEQATIADVLDSADGVVQSSKELLGIFASLHREQMRGPTNRLKIALLQNLLTGRVRVRSQT